MCRIHGCFHHDRRTTAAVSIASALGRHHQRWVSEASDHAYKGPEAFQAPSVIMKGTYCSMFDRYGDFASLAMQETEGEHYRVRLVDRASPIAVVAPHGGVIEPGTSEIAAAIAGDAFSVYCFEGLHPDRPHGDLHITSSRFDEPRGLQLVEASDLAVTVHGRRNHGDRQTIWLGGLDAELCDAIGEALMLLGLGVKTTGHHLKGNGPNNICNRGRRKKGAQLELPHSIRNQCLASPSLSEELGMAVRSAVQRFYLNTTLTHRDLLDRDTRYA